MRCKSLCLLSFSLAFLSHGIASEEFYEEDEFEIAEDSDDGYYYNDGRYLSDSRQDTSDMDSDDSQECLSRFHRVHIGVRHNEARGIGYKDGYTTLEAFGIYDQWSEYFMPFFDLRGHIFNNGKWAANAGLGERTVIPCINHTFGSFLYYDFRDVGHGLSINQISPGLELVGKRMEYRINGYFPLGKDEGRQYKYKFDKFDGNNILLRSRRYHALKGGDAEIGVHLTQSTKFDVYTAGGAYYLHSPHASSWGGRARLLGRYKEYVSLEVDYSYDHLFRSVVQGSVALTLPLGCKLRRSDSNCPQGNDLLLSRASFAPSRFEIPMAKRIHPRSKAINPATGAPWVVWFVNNTSSSNGTIESPFPTLLQAQNASSPNEMIYVFSGDGTTKGMDTGIVLQDNQLFFGSGFKQRFPTTKGTMTIPAMTANSPSISATLSTVVNLGNGDTVSGFNIIGLGAATPVGTNLTSVNGAVIQNNNIVVPSGANAGIVLPKATGSINIFRNQITGTTNSEGVSIQLANGAQLIVSENSFSGLFFGIDTTNSTATLPISLQITKNAFLNYQGALLLQGLTSANVTISENLFSTNIGTSQSVILRRTLTSVVSNNAFTTNTGAISVNTQTSVGNSYTTSIFKNLINATGTGPAIQLLVPGSDSLCASVFDNQVTISVPTTVGLSASTTGTGSINIDNLKGNVIPNVSISGNVNLVPLGTCGN